MGSQIQQAKNSNMEKCFIKIFNALIGRSDMYIFTENKHMFIQA